MDTEELNTTTIIIQAQKQEQKDNDEQIQATSLKLTSSLSQNTTKFKDLIKRQQYFKKRLHDIEQNLLVKQQLSNVLFIKKQQQQQQRQEEEEEEQLTDDSDFSDGDDGDDEEVVVAYENENEYITNYNLHETLHKHQQLNEFLLQQQQQYRRSLIVLPPQLRLFNIYASSKQRQQQQQQQKKVNIDDASKTSKWYWNMNRVALKSEYERVRLKMLNLNKMNRNCKKLLKKIKPAISKNNNKKKNKNKNKIDENSINSDDVDEDVGEEEDDDDESTMRSQRCIPHHRKTTTSTTAIFKRSLIRYDLLKPYMNLIKFLLVTCSCKTDQMCILCYLNKNQMDANLEKYKFASTETLKQVFLDHSYTKFYRPVTFYEQHDQQQQLHHLDNQQYSNNDIDLNSSTSSTITTVNLLKTTSHLSPSSQTPPPTPKSPSTSSVLSTNTDFDQQLMLNDIVLTESTKHHNKTSSYCINHNKTVINMHHHHHHHHHTNTMLNNDIMLDAGSELDPNDVHKLPNIYEELRYLCQNDENLLNGICESNKYNAASSLLRKQKLKRKWYEYCNSSSHDLVSCLTNKIKKEKKVQQQANVHQPALQQRQQYNNKDVVKVVKRKRLSTSTCSTSSLAADSVHNKSTSYIILNDSHNKFDIDNIVIPHEMLNTETKIDIIQNKEIQTPSWRVVFADHTDDDTDADEEDLSDDCFTKRHELHELKERYYTVFQKLEKKKANQNQQQQQQLECSTFTTPQTKLEDLCLNEFKLLVNKLENEHKTKNNNACFTTNNTSFLNNNNNNNSKYLSLSSSSYFNTNNNGYETAVAETLTKLSWPERKFPLLNDTIETASTT